MPDNVDKLFEIMQAKGAASDRNKFRQVFLTPGDKGYKIRKDIYDGLKADGIIESPTYEDFRRKLRLGGTPMVNKYRQRLFNSVDPSKNEASKLTKKAVVQAKRATNTVRKPVTAKVVDQNGKPTSQEFAITPAKTVEDLDREYAQETTQNWENQLRREKADADSDAAKISDMFKSFINDSDEVGGFFQNINRGGGIAGVPHSVTTNNGLIESEEARQLIAAGNYNLERKRLLQLEQDTKNGKWLDDHSFFRGMLDAAKDIDNWTGGAQSLIYGGALLATKQDLDKGKHTKAGDMLLQAAVKNADAQGLYADNQGWMYSGGVITTNMIPFMSQIASAGFTGTMSRGIGKVVQGVASSAGKGAMKNMSKIVGTGIAKNIGKFTGLTTKAFGKAIQYGLVGAAQANTVGIGNIANDVLKRYTGQVYQDKDGNYKFGTFDNDGNLVHDGGEDFLTSLVKGETAQTIEFATELAGGGIDAAGAALKKFFANGGKKIIDKYNMENVSKVIDFMLNNKLSKNVRYLKAGADRTLGKVEVSSVVGESLEEELGIIANSLFTGDNKISDLWDKKQQAQIWGGMLLSIGLMKGMVMPIYAYNAKHYYSYKHKLDKADVNLSQLLGKEKWDELRNEIDGTTNRDMPQMYLKVIRDTSLGKNREAIIEYIGNLTKMRGYDIGNMLAAKKAINDNGRDVSVRNMAQNQAYQQGHEAEGTNTHEIQIDNADKQKTLAQLLGITEQQVASMSNDELESLTGQDDNLDRAIYEYQLSNARYQGVIDNAQDKVDLAVQQASQAVDMYTDKSRGTVRNATIKGTQGANDYGVYIINGNVATHDDGSIDISNSDKMIIYFDPQTGKVEHADASRFAALGDENPADEVKTQAMADAKENAIKEQSGIIDGRVDVGTQFNVTDENGVQHTYEVLADNGDGTAMITFDGNVEQNPYSFEDLQNLKDMEDQKLLETAKAQREQMEAQREQQKAEQQKQEEEKQKQLGKILSNIIDDNGNVVIAAVEGNEDADSFVVGEYNNKKTGVKKYKVVTLNADGTVSSPRLVDSSKVRVIDTMSADEYKENMDVPDSSIVVDNSGDNNVSENTQLDNLGLPKGSEIWMRGDGIGRPKENTQSKVVGIDEQGNIILEDKDGKQWSASFEYISNHLELPPLDENTNIVNDENNQTESNDVTLTFEDGSTVPMTTDSKGRPAPDYDNMTAEQSAEVLQKQFGEGAEKVADARIKKAEKAVEDAEKMKVDYSGEDADIIEQEKKKAAAIAAAQDRLEKAQAIKKAMTAKKVAETMAKPKETKVESAHEAGKETVEKFQNSKRLKGNHVTKRLPTNEKISGHYEIVPAESLTPSHDVNNDYKKSEGFPVDEEGRTINDRDYEHDKAAQQTTDQMAQKYSGQAITNVPTVSDEGIVYDGNGRTMAGQKAAKNGTDAEYIEDLMDNAENYGFTREQIEQSGIEHPRLVMVTDERLPYDTATFAKFNRNEKKTQSNTEQAVAKAKTLTPDEVGAIVSEIEGNGSLDAFFNNSKSVNDLIKTLQSKGVLGQNEVAGYMEDNGRLNAQGREFVKNLLLGAVFKPETIRMLGVEPSLKNKAIAGIRSIMDNMKLGDYSLRDEIDHAIQLMYEAKKANSKNVAEHMRTSDLEGSPRERYTPMEQAIAQALDGSASLFRDLIEEYNKIAKTEKGTGEAEMFGARLTPEEVNKAFLDVSKTIKDNDIKLYANEESGNREKEGSNHAASNEESTKEAGGEKALEKVVPYAKALKQALESGDKKAIEKAQQELTDAMVSNNLGLGYLYSQLAQYGLIKRKDDSYKLSRAIMKSLKDAIQTVENSLDSAIQNAGLGGVHIYFNEFGEGWIYADKGSEWYNRLEALDNNYRWLSQDNITIDNASKIANIIKSQIEEGERYNAEDDTELSEEKLRFSAKEGPLETPEERAANVEKNKVEDTDVVDAIIGKKMRKSLDRIAKMMGAKIQYQYTDKKNNGWYDASTNTIYIALDSSIIEGVQFVFGHEMAHEIKDKNPAAFEELKNLVKNSMGEDVFNAETDKMQERYKKGGASYWNDRDAIEEEVVADGIGYMMRNLNYAHTLALKMSHPLLAKLHEIINRIRMAFYGTEYTEQAKQMMRSIERAYVATANREANNTATQEGEGGQRLSLRTKEAPKKTQKVYKLMRLNPAEEGKLFPLFIGNGEAVELGKWYDADSPKLQDLTSLSSKDYVGTRTVSKDGKKVKENYNYGVYIVNNKTGEAMSLADFKDKYKGDKTFSRIGNNPNVAALNWATDNGYRWIKIEEKSQGQSRYGGENRSYYNYGINGTGAVSIFAMRPGWHAGSLPTMRQIGKGKDRNLRDDNFVWVEGEIPADIDYNEEAQKNADKDIPDHIPTDGYYLKATNANKEASQADKVGWYVAGAFKPNRIMSDKETRDIIDQWNNEHPSEKVEYDWKRESGKDFNTETMSLEDSPKFSLKVYHGSGADFSEFDFDHMGEGAGSQAFGWGGYVTSSEKIGKYYANLNRSNAVPDDVFDTDNKKSVARQVQRNIAQGYDKSEAIQRIRNGFDAMLDYIEKDEPNSKNAISIYKEKKKILDDIECGKLPLPAMSLYEVNIPDDKGSNYLDWDAPLSDELIDKVTNALPTIRAFDIKNFKKDRSFEDLYRIISMRIVEDENRETNGVFNDDKAASKFLSSLGFIGIKYKAGRNFGGAEEGDTNYVIFKPEDMQIAEHTKFSIKTFHGSQADFDHFDHSFMGSGEGAQAYGWGTYVSEVQGIAKAYAKQNAAKHSANNEYVFKAKQEFEDAKSFYDKAFDAYNRQTGNVSELMEQKKLYEDVLPNARERFEAAKARGNKFLERRFTRNISVLEANIKSVESKISEEEENLKEKEKALADAKAIYQKAKDYLDSLKPERNLYTVDIPDDTGDNYLGWDDKLSDDIVDRIGDALNKKGVEGDVTTGGLSYGDYVKKNKGNWTGSLLYRNMAATLGGQKEASMLLNDAGFDGVKVIAQRNTGGNKEGKMNYVIFDENNAKITNHTKFSLKDPYKMSDNEKKERGEKLINASAVDVESGIIQKKDGLSARKVAEQWWKDNIGKPLYYDTEIGRVEINDNSIKDSLAHRYSQAKLDAITSLPIGFNNSVYLGTLKDFTRDGDVNNHYFAYPINYDGKRNYVFCRAMQDANKNRLYVHEVFVADKINEGNTLQTAASQPHGGIALYKDILTNILSTAKIDNSSETSKENGEKVDGNAPKTFDEFLKSPSMKFSIKNDEQRKAAQNAYDYAVNLRPDRHAQYALVDMARPETPPEYYEKKVLANRWKSFYNKKVKNDWGKIVGKPYGSYKLFDLDRPFEEQVNKVDGNVPGNFEAPVSEPNKNDDNESGAEYRNSSQQWVPSSVSYQDRYEAFKRRIGLGKLKNQVEIAENAYKAKQKERSDYHNQLMKEYMDKHGLSSQFDIPGDVWQDLREKSFEKYQDELDELFHKYVALDKQLKDAKQGTRFSLKDEKTMFGMHNITLDKLRKAIKQGGFAAPSMGVIDSKNGIYSDYGEITLIPKAEKLAKSKGKNAGTFLGDGWTPIYPKVEKIMSKQGEKTFNKDMDKLYDDVDVNIWSNIKESWNGYFSNGDVRNGLYFQYLQEKGMNPEVVYQKGKYDKSVFDKVKSIVSDFNKVELSDSEVTGLMKLMNEVTGKDNSVDGKRKELENNLKEAQKKDNKLLIGFLKKQISELDGMEDYWIADGFMRKVIKDADKKGKIKISDTLEAAKKKVVDDKKLSSDFDAWLEKKEEEYDAEEMLYTGTTPTGKPKYIPNTVENAVKLMKKKQLAGGYGMFGGIGSFIAKHSDMATTLKQMKAAKEKLISKADAEKRDKMRDEISREFRDLANQIDVPGGYSFDAGDARMLELADHKGHEKEYIKKEYNMDVSDEWVDRYNKLVNTIKNDYPVFYFETKFMRPYGLDEFEKAIVPKDTPKDVVDALKKAGIDVRTYEGNEDREKVTLDAINSSGEIRFSLKSMEDKPEGWKQANKKAIHIAEAIERDPKFSLKKLDGTLIKAGTYFSGGGLVEEGLKGIIDPVVAVEYDEKISGVYRNNFGQHLVTADVRDVDPKELVKSIDGDVEYFHASPVCKNYSKAKANHEEVELDKETAQSTADFINQVKPKVVTIENVKGYRDSEAMKIITDALNKNGYRWDADVYNAADYGGYTNRERLIVRAVKDGELPEKPKKMARKKGWYEAVEDIMPTLIEKKNGVAPWMDIRLKADGIDWRNIDKPLYVMGSAYADGKVPHAFADELLPTLRTKSGDVIVMPDGKVYRANGRVLARVSGVSDDYKMPYSEALSHTIIGNGIPTQLTEHVIAPLIKGTLKPTSPEDAGNTKFSLRVDQFEHDLEQWKKDNNLPKDAVRPSIPIREPNESAADFLKRVKEYRKQMALWKTAPQYEGHLLSDDTAQGQFNLELQKGSVLARIAIQDSMLPIRKAQEAIMKEAGVDRLNIAEDAYTAENRSHGKGKNEFEEYNDEFLQPLRKAYNKMMKNLGKSYDNVKVYMIAKHGLERNAHMAFKKSLDADYEKQEERIKAYQAYKSDIDRLINDADFESGKIDFTTWRQKDNAIRLKYAPSYLDYRYDKMGITQDYSGLSELFGGSDFEEAAADLVKDVESNHPADAQELWNTTNAATKKILRDSYKADMMSKDVYEYVRGMYQNYIPLRGWGDTNADQVWNYMGGGKGAFNQTLKKANGRGSLADDPIAYIENMAESGILINNKNWVKRHLLLLAENHPTSLLNVSKAWYIKTIDANGNEEWIPASPQITANMTARQVDAAIDAFQKKMEALEQKGDATQKREHLEISYPQTNSEEREHEVRVMKDGEEYVIYINGDPQLAQAMNNTRAHRVRQGMEENVILRNIEKLGRKMAAAYTSLNPLFIPSNFFRDTTMTLASTAIREDARYNYLLRKNMLTHWNTYGMVRSYQNGTLREKVRNGEASKTERMFYDFMMNGGETGFVSSLDVEDLKKKFKNELKDMNRMALNPKKVGHFIMDEIETLNRAIEDSNRFVVYMTSIQYGRSIDEAVNDAKDVTLNFNRKGTGEHGWQTIRNLYLFINPAIQSLQTLGALAKHHPFKFTAVTTAWLASGMLVPMVNYALMSMFGGDDDKDKYWSFTKWDRRNNFILWVPGTHEFIKIPLAQEFRGFYGVGDMIASKLWGGDKAQESWEDYGWDLLGQVIDMLPLDPTGYDGNVAVSLMPNPIRPMFELAFNVDFTGKPLFKDSEYNKYDPNFTKAYAGTPDWLVRISRMVNSIGNDYPDFQQNFIDKIGDPRFNLNNPAVVDHVLSSYLGGAYTMGSQILGVATKALNGDDIKMADIPLLSKFVSNPDDRPVSKKQGDEFWTTKERHDRAANTLSKLKKKAKVDGDYSTLDVFFNSDEYEQYKKDDKVVKKYEEDKKKERAEESGDEYKPHKTTYSDIYKAHATPKDDFEDLKLSQLYNKVKAYASKWNAMLDVVSSQADDYYNENAFAIQTAESAKDIIDQMNDIKKDFLSDDGKDAWNAEDMGAVRELRKQAIPILEKANKVLVAKQKAKAEKK